MRDRGPIFLLLVAAMMTLIVAVNVKRLGAAEEQLAAAVATYRAAGRDAREILELRAGRQMIAHAEHPTQDVIARINDVLDEAGLPDQSMAGLTPQTDLTLGSPAASDAGTLSYRRQSLQLSLDGLSIPELGRFLARWKATQPLWTVTRIELVHERGGNLGSDRYDVSLLLATVYVADP